MRDERIIQAIVNGLSIWSHAGSKTKTFKMLEPRAKDVLAALRADGWDLYRPEEAQRICTCNYTEGIDASDDPKEHNSWCEAVSGRQWILALL